MIEIMALNLWFDYCKLKIDLCKILVDGEILSTVWEYMLQMCRLKNFFAYCKGKIWDTIR